VRVTEFDRATAFQTIEHNLASFIGESMARSSLKMHGEKLGLMGPTITRKDLEHLLEQIRLAMRVFIGANRADSLTQQILARFSDGEP
jgi:hypothetical protein